MILLCARQGLATVSAREELRLPVAEVPLRRRVARLSLLSVGLAALTIALLLMALWVAVGAETRQLVGQLPVGAPAALPRFSLAVAVGAAVAACFVGLAALHAAAAMRILARDRRIPPPLSPELRQMRRVMLTPLGPAAVRLLDEPQLPPTKLPDVDDATRAPLRLTVFVPAHDEALTIAATLDSLWQQTRPPDKVVVVADNCTDDTAEVARRHGAEVFTTVANRDKKAGALNQALAQMFAAMASRDVAMIMDADSVIVPEFLATAMGRLDADPDLIAVGGVSTARVAPASSGSCNATSTAVTSATSRVAWARCSCLPAPPPCSAPTR